ncbi:MAG: DUF1573 domain-containing protein [Clostridia bacterium]|nr:DUF1573 domain-containing protein [Clostridia bacterium]
MNDCIKDISETIDKYYRRNRSLVDTMSKAQLSLEKTIRAITKAATHCGCIEFCAKKQPCGLDETVPVLSSGSLCTECSQEVEKELGQSAFYLISLMILLGYNPIEIIERENINVRLLGKFNLR